jgi:Protein of unknown function (DUF3309)
VSNRAEPIAPWPPADHIDRAPIRRAANPEKGDGIMSIGLILIIILIVFLLGGFSGRFGGYGYGYGNGGIGLIGIILIILLILLLMGRI